MGPEHESSEGAGTVLETGRDSRVEINHALETSDDQQELREALITATQDRDRLLAALDEAAVEKAELQRELNATVRRLRHLARSRTVRITRPIRAAGAAFRRTLLSDRGRST
jgi:hypothetical protein